MTVARGAALGALLLGGVLLALTLLGGGGGYRYKLRFQNAGQLVKGDDVQVGGRPVGTVDAIRLANRNQAEIDVTIDKGFGRLREGTRATIRATSLSGIANRYIALAPGPDNRPALGDGAVVATDKTTSIVDLDQLFATFDAKTRAGLRGFIRGNADQFRGRGAQANQAAEYFNPALATTRRLVNEVNRDSTTLARFLVDSQRAVTALAARKETLTDLVSNSNQAAQGIVAANQDFSTSLRRLPATLRRGNSTFVNLRATLGDLDVLVAESKPATKRLAPFLRVLRPLVTDARPTIRDLRLAIRRPGADNDLVELLRKAPRLAELSRPSFRNAVKALDRSNPFLRQLRAYSPELVGWFRDFGQGAANYDANGHYARIQPVFNTFSFTDNAAGGLLTPTGPNNRLDGLVTGQFKRCPGGPTQPAADGSAPFNPPADDLGCDPSQVFPGP